MGAPVYNCAITMSSGDNPSLSVLEYFRALRTEIIEAQKLRVQVGMAKTVFLGTLLGIFFKKFNDDPAILICPFVALMFDCMVYGLSHNIRDVGSFIGEHIERQMGLGEDGWQLYRRQREDRGVKDRGRIAFRVGSYGLSAAVTVVSFAEAKTPVGTALLASGSIWPFALMGILGVAWSTLICAEFPPRMVEKLRQRLTGRRNPRKQATPLPGAGDGTEKEARGHTL